MLTAERTGFWGTKYNVAEEGTPVTVWDTNTWASGGKFVLAGQAFHVRAGTWGTRFTLLDDRGAVVAEAERVGRKNWTLQSGGRTYTFRRPSIWRGDQHLVDGERTVGVVRMTSSWTGSLSADLPGLPLALQIFVLGMMIAQYQSAAAAV